MSDQNKTKEELIIELETLRRRIRKYEEHELTIGIPRQKNAAGQNDAVPPSGFPLQTSVLPRPLAVDDDSTETIDLNALFTKDVTDSGSFDIRGEIWKTTFGKVLQALPITALLIDQHLSIIVANEASRRFSPDYEDILGSSFCSLFPETSAAQKAQFVVQAVFDDRKPRGFSALLHICSTRIWGRFTLRSIRIMNERFVLGLLEDLTRETEQLILNQKHQKLLQREIAERRASEDALKQSEARFRQIYDYAPMMMISLDRDRAIRSVNAKWLNEMGYSREEVLGNKIDLVLTKGGRKAFVDAFEKWWNLEEIHDASFQYVKKDGATIDVLVDSVTIDDPVWGPVIVSTIRDVTHELFLEKQLREAQKMEALGTLAGGVAHDFNNLLQIIFGYADLIMMRVDKQSPNYRGIRAIREAARRGSDLVKQVLTFSRRVETNPRPLDLNHEVKKASQLLARTIPKMINIEVALAEDLKTIYADPIQVEQIILNLAVNAKDAMPDGGTLTLETENVSLEEEYCRKCPEVNPGDYVCLRVSDTGHGMAPEVLEHIFEPFFTTKKPGEGTGLGLSTVFGLVKMHAGHISCHSKRQTGTVFRIYFPAIEQRVPWDMETTSEMPAFGTETVLLIDDEDMVRTWGKELLAHAGYTVLSASNGREGLELYRQRRSEISLVILDLIMPEMGGKQCLASLLQINSDLKAIVASGFPIDQKTKEFLEHHARGIIAKPFHAKELLRVVRLVLDAG